MTDLTLSPTNIRPLPGAEVSGKEAGEAMSLGTVVYVAGDSKIYKTDADDATKCSGQIGLVVSGGQEDRDGDIASGEFCGVLWFGRVALNGKTLDETKQFYISGTAGKIADAAGTVTRRLGAAESATILFFNPQSSAPTS